MSEGLDVIIVDDDENICDIISQNIERFYTWGDVIKFSDADKAIEYCLDCDIGVAIFIVDVFLGDKSGFFFLDSVAERFPMVHEDTIIISGNASDDVVNMCVASDVSYLLEKPVKPYALQLAVRAIVSKYLKFSKRLMQDTEFAATVSSI